MPIDNASANAYLRTKVMTAGREELRLLLLDGALKFANQGREGLTKKNYEQSYLGISQCRDIVMELLTTIKPEYQPELCEKIKALYAFMYQRLVEASMEKSVAKLDEVIKLLEFERETWVLLMQELAKQKAPAGPLKLVSATEQAAQAAGELRASLSLEA